MKIKEWKYNEIMDRVLSYGDLWMSIDVKRSGEFNMAEVVDGYVTLECRFEVLKETEKAVYANIADSWKTWIPKSALKED